MTVKSGELSLRETSGRGLCWRPCSNNIKSSSSKSSSSLWLFVREGEGGVLSSLVMSTVVFIWSWSSLAKESMLPWRPTRRLLEDRPGCSVSEFSMVVDMNEEENRGLFGPLLTKSPKQWDCRCRFLWRQETCLENSPVKKMQRLTVTVNNGHTPNLQSFFFFMDVPLDRSSTAYLHGRNPFQAKNTTGEMTVKRDVLLFESVFYCLANKTIILLIMEDGYLFSISTRQSKNANTSELCS